MPKRGPITFEDGATTLRDPGQYGCEACNYASPPDEVVVRLLEGGIEGISPEIRQQLMEALNPTPDQCACDPNKFPTDKRTVCKEAAIRYYNMAMEAMHSKEQEIKEKADKAKVIIEAIIGASKSEVAQGIADELIFIKNIKIQDIVHTFEARKELFTDGKNPTMDNPEKFEELIRLFKARKPIKAYLRKLLIERSELDELDLIRIWREKLASNGKNSAESEDARKSMVEISATANLYCSTFFTPHTLHADVEQCANLDELSEIVRTTIPLTVDKFRKLVSAISKINMMHLIDILRSQIDFDQMKKVSGHLQKLIDARKAVLPDMRELFTCGDPEAAKASNSIIVESIQVAAEKKEESAARKYMDKGSENIKDSDVLKIKDWIRFRIMLTKEDSASPEKTKKATLKTLGILFALMGTDLERERLRYALDVGSVNNNSTGRHQAFHLTIGYRYQCGGKVMRIPVEIQIQKYMDSDALQEDHKDYVQIKDKKNTTIAAMNVNFYTFITDLCDLLLSDYDPEAVSQDDTNLKKRPQKEKMALLLFMILTAKKSDGTLENGRIIREIFQDEKQREKLIRLINYYKDYIPYAKQNQPPESRGSNPTLINKLVNEIGTILMKMGRSAAT